MPSDSKRLRIIDRLVTVLKGISAGTTYHTTPLDVFKGYRDQVQGYPALAVRNGDIGSVAHYMDHQVEEDFELMVCGKVFDAGDIVTPRERLLQDARKAIDADLLPASGAGSLITLVVAMSFGPVTLDDGPEGNGFFGYFEQRLNVKISGEIGD